MILHVVNGDSTRLTLQRTAIPGDVTVWADVLHDGPAPRGVSGEAWRQLRAHHLASQGHGRAAAILEQLRRADERLERHERYDEVVFWLEHDLFDQLLLIRHLHWLSETVADRSRVRMICIDSFPGHPDFGGLGELNPVELASLFPHRQLVTDAQVAQAAALWSAFGATDPRPFASLVVNGDTSALPFAAPALRRQLEDFPSTVDGLARTERQILTAIRDGHRDAVEVFMAAAGFEERVFMGDTVLWAWLRRMTEGPAPAIALDGVFRPEGAPLGIFRLTDSGRAVLNGQADYIDLNGIDRWMGGTHLTDGNYRWTGDGVIRMKEEG